MKKKTKDSIIIIAVISLILGFLLMFAGIGNSVIFYSGLIFASIPIIFLLIFIGYASVISANAEEEAKKQRIANDKAEGQMITCPVCNNQVSSKAKSCPECGNPIDTKVYCPKCSSSNTKPISNTDKALSIGLVGVYAANKVVSKYKCLDCNHNF